MRSQPNFEQIFMPRTRGSTQHENGCGAKDVREVMDLKDRVDAVDNVTRIRIFESEGR